MNEQKDNDNKKSIKPTSKKKKTITYICLAIYFCVAIGVLAYSTYSDYQKEQEEKAKYSSLGIGSSKSSSSSSSKSTTTKPEDKIKLSISPSSISVAKDYEDAVIYVQNNSNKDISYIRVDIFIKDKNGKIVQSDWTNDSSTIKSGASQNIKKHCKMFVVVTLLKSN